MFDMELDVDVVWLLCCRPRSQPSGQSITVARRSAARDLLCSATSRACLGGQKPRLAEEREGRTVGPERDGTGGRCFVAVTTLEWEKITSAVQSFVDM